MPTIEMLPETFLAAAPVLLPPLVPLELLSLLPHPATATSAATASRLRTVAGPLRLVVIQILLSPGRRRCPGPFQDRRNAGCGCPRRPPRRHPRQPGPAVRTDPRPSRSVLRRRRQHPQQ